MIKNGLIDKYPSLVNEWDYTENIEIDIKKITYGSAKTVNWICKKGHKWKAQVKKRAIRGDGCPYCSGKRPIAGENDLATLYPDVADQWDYESNQSDPSEYLPKSNKKCYWICEKGHRWKSGINTRTRGRGCPYCAHKRIAIGETDLQSRHPEIAEQWNYEKNTGLKPTGVSYGSNRRIWWKCVNGHEWSDTVKNRVKITHCPLCVPENRLSVIAPEIFQEIHPTKNAIKVTDISAQSNHFLWWRCKEGHEWYAQVYNRFRGDGCPYCSGKRVITGINDLKSSDPILCQEWDYVQNHNKRPENYARFSNKRVWWICKEGHRWRTSIDHRSNGTSCPYCN